MDDQALVEGSVVFKDEDDPARGKSPVSHSLGQEAWRSGRKRIRRACNWEVCHGTDTGIFRAPGTVPMMAVSLLPPPGPRRGPSPTHLPVCVSATPALLLSTRLHLCPWPVSELVTSCWAAQQGSLAPAPAEGRPSFLPTVPHVLQNLASLPITANPLNGYSLALAPDPTIL